MRYSRKLTTNSNSVRSASYSAAAEAASPGGAKSRMGECRKGHSPYEYDGWRTVQDVRYETGSVSTHDI